MEPILVPYIEDRYNTNTFRDTLVTDIIDGGVTGSVCGLGILGNLLALAVLCRVSHRQTTVIFLSALAVSDCCLLLYLLLTKALPGLCSLSDRRQCTSILMSHDDRYLWFLGCVSQTWSTWITLLLTLDRWIAVCRPFLALRLSTRKSAVLAIVVTMAAAGVFNTPRIFHWHPVGKEVIRPASPAGVAPPDMDQWDVRPLLDWSRSAYPTGDQISTPHLRDELPSVENVDPSYALSDVPKSTESSLYEYFLGPSTHNTPARTVYELQDGDNIHEMTENEESKSPLATLRPNRYSQRQNDDRGDVFETGSNLGIGINSHSGPVGNSGSKYIPSIMNFDEDMDISGYFIVDDEDPESGFISGDIASGQPDLTSGDYDVNPWYMYSGSRASEINKDLGVHDIEAMHSSPSKVRTELRDKQADIRELTLITYLKDNLWYRYIYYMGATWLLLYVIPVVLLSVLNTLLIRAIRLAKLSHAALTRNEQRPNSKDSVNVTGNVVVIVTVFLVCQSPDFALVVLQSWPDVVRDKQTLSYMSSASHLLLALNSSLNVVIYFLYYKKFRSVAKSMMTCKN